MIGVFKANSPNNTFVLLIYGLLLNAGLFIAPQPPAFGNLDGPLYKIIADVVSFMGGLFPPFYGFISFLPIYLQAVYLCRLTARYRMFAKVNYLPGMAWMLFISMNDEWGVFSSQLMVSCILLFLVWQLNNLYNSNNPLKIIFFTSAVVGLTTMVHIPAVLFLLLVYISLLLYRPFKLQEWVMPLVAFTVPFYFYFSTIYLMDRFANPFFTKLNLNLQPFDFSYWKNFGYLLSVLVGILGIYHLQNNYLKMTIHSRKSWVMVYWSLIIGVMAAVVNYTFIPWNWLLTAVPIALLMSVAFYNIKNKWVALLLHWALFIFAVIGSYAFLILKK